MKATRVLLACAAFAMLLPRPAAANFHLMQIEQVIGGVNGNTNAQAIQLRMRATGENFVSGARLVVSDASGANPVVLIAFPSDVTNGTVGSRVLVATSDFSNATSTALTPDFVLTNPIPASYLAAGSLTYETSTGSLVLWRLSWGGGAYTGSGAGSTFDDADGNFNPPFAGPLPSTTDQALLFQFGATALSTNNANDYALTPGAATFTNNSGGSGVVLSTASVANGATRDLIALSPPTPNPVRNSMAYSVTLSREAGVQVKILDVDGRVVRTLVDETMPAGQHSFTWRESNRTGSELPDGLYFLEMNAEETRSIQRFALIH